MHLFDLGGQASNTLDLTSSEVHIKVFGKGFDPVFFRLKNLQNLRLPTDSLLDLSARHDALSNNFLARRIHDHSHAHKGLNKPASWLLADGEVHHAKVLRQELYLGEADVGYPRAFRVVSCLVDPDLLGFIGELDETVLDKAHLGGCNACSYSAFLERQWCGGTVIAKSNVYLVIVSVSVDERRQ